MMDMSYAEREIKRLSDFLFDRCSRDGESYHGESAVDVAIRLLTKEEEIVLVRGERQHIEDFNKIKDTVESIW